MGKENEKKWIKIFVLLTFIAMVSVNALANILPINGVNTGQVSDSYPNLFTPAAYTFAIWGLIYFFLAIYSLYHMGLLRRQNIRGRERFLNRIGICFSISSIANMLWILAWHYGYIGISVILMGIILISLIRIHSIMGEINLTPRERFFVRLPFSIYFGWITVATIANITAFLVSINWNGFGISESIWTVIILLVGVLIGSLTLIKDRNIPYGLVIVWAYVGILMKHISDTGFGGEYRIVIVTTIISIIITIASMIYAISRPRKQI